MRIWPWSVIEELRKANANLNRRLEQSERDMDPIRREATAKANQVTFLVRTIRDMDEQIFKMSQCTDWNQMRPNFGNLLEGMLVRKRTESDRINDLLQGEIVKSYAPQLLSDKS